MKNILITLLILSPITVPAQASARLPNKTLKDSVFMPGDVIRIPEVYYDLSEPVSPMVIDSLKPAAAFLKKHAALKVEIGYYTDSRGDAGANLSLSSIRAENVRDYLTEVEGIDPARISCTGYGETAPVISDAVIAKAKTNQERDRLHKINRRTVMRVTE